MEWKFDADIDLIRLFMGIIIFFLLGRLSKR